ncbi:ribosomal protein S6 kinase alpha-5-like [Culicoides brevitarsis]|uniref:ribosomal protein S6 kinase alpha-5-like n=1 Tax=Culicoides brevitarsis TaxID=469753 RepID=UPI00307BFAAE
MSRKHNNFETLYEKKTRNGRPYSPYYEKECDIDQNTLMAEIFEDGKKMHRNNNHHHSSSNKQKKVPFYQQQKNAEHNQEVPSPPDSETEETPDQFEPQLTTTTTTNKDILNNNAEDDDDEVTEITQNPAEDEDDDDVVEVTEENPSPQKERNDSCVITGTYTRQDYDPEIEEISRIRTNVILRDSDKVGLKDFDVLKVLGTGAYGKVFLVRKKNGCDQGKLYAMKVIKKAAIIQKKKTAEHIRAERQVLEAVRKCPFLITMHYAFQTESKLHLVLDYMNGGELFTHLFQREQFSEDEVRVYVAEIVLALEQLHKLGIIYRDIKLENILLDRDGHIVITDFGLSKELTPDTNGRAHSFCGTLEYMAPEVVKQNQNGHDIAVDWWSVGVLTYELLTGASPFTIEGERNTQSEVSKRILKTDPPLRGMSNDVRDFIQKLLVKDPRKRLGGNGPDATEIKSHAFFDKINWRKLEQRKIAAPFVPKIADDLDTSNFSEDFTRLPVTDAPTKPTPNTERLFRGYSFVAASILLKKSSSDVVVECSDSGLSERPNAFNVVNYKVVNSPFWKKYDIVEKKPIGEGSYSICMKCQDRSTKKLYAVKVVRATHDVTKETNALRLCQSNKNVVTLIEVLRDAAYTFIITELLEGGELFERIRTSRCFTEKKARTYFRQIVDAVAFMHAHGIAHRDLKPENILFQHPDSHTLKIVDFGFAEDTNASSTATPCFTLGYAAPEVLHNDVTSMEASDLWSLGVILYTMLCGQTPFLSNTENAARKETYISEMVSRIQRGSFDTGTDYWNLVSHSARNLVEGLLTVDPATRFSLKEIQKHPWMQETQKSTAFLHTPESRQMCDTKDTFDAFSHAQKLGFAPVPATNLLTSRRHNKKSGRKRSHSTSDDSSTSELGRSKSSSNIILTSDPNCRSISSGVLTASSDIEYKGSSTNAKNANNSSHQHVISISDDDEEAETDCSNSSQVLRCPSIEEPDFYGFDHVYLLGFTKQDMRIARSLESWVQKHLKRPMRTVEISNDVNCWPATRSRIRTKRVAIDADSEFEMLANSSKRRKKK